jgi:hypothetical protein
MAGCFQGREKRFFLKKEAKTFATGAAHGRGRMRRAVGAGAKVFWFFFSKKNFFSHALP